MRRIRLAAGLVCLSFAAVMAIGPTAIAKNTILQNNKKFENPTGKSSSFSRTGSIDLTGSFFQSLGTNGRTCETCHLASDGWTVSARSARDIFEDSDGLAALFEFDGQNCPGADRSTKAARRAASSLMINKALVRFAKTLPPLAEFEIIAAEGTYCNVTDTTNYVVFRRPLPTVNFGAFGTSLWDGLGNTIAPSAPESLPLIFVGATQLHAETSFTPTDAQIAQGVAFMNSITNAQIVDDDAGKLDKFGAKGGAENHSAANLNGPPGFSIYNPWLNLPGNGGKSLERESVARGQEIFNLRAFSLAGVTGLPPGVTSGTCAGCHRVPNQGNTAGVSLLNIGIADGARRTPDLPLYTLRNKTSLAVVKTTDPGRAAVTGLWADIGKFKVPGLRGLAARAPYFHDGSAATLEGVVGFYNGRFNIGLTAAERNDLVSFLRAL
jgi:cytochrome c peroxidase